MINATIETICSDCSTPTFCDAPHGAGHDHSDAAIACTRRALDNA